ncbi:HTH-type transcriptional regulator IscR [bacterium BMS3Abin07]|nr:HTH-type transcriptional regulator IscR [bacterium BMS3Abin07]GBE31985.1 HTH-type transcriptional regulator IscR [bacterium BMS3Bbin05]
MYEIALGYPDNVVNIKKVSEKQDVSVPYLEQILNKLKKAGLIRSIKGPGGGYLLNKAPEKITIGSIVSELEGPVAITSCLDPSEGCIRAESCVIHLLWKALGQQIVTFLDSITLSDLLKGTSFEDFAQPAQKTDSGDAQA